MDIKHLKQLYLVDRLSQREIAKFLSISQTTVRYYLIKHNLTRNTKTYSKVNIDKVCPKCQIFKLASEFYHSTKGNRIKKPGSWCKLCMKKQVLERQRKYKQQFIDYKGGKCQICGYNKYQGALEFHHLNPKEKDFEVSKFSKKLLDSTMKSELDKCILLCSNCHREEHGKLSGSFK